MAGPVGLHTRNRSERRAEIKKLLEELGRWNISITELAEKWNVNFKTIYRDIDYLTKDIPKEDVEKLSYDLSVGYKKAFKEMMKILALSKDEKAKIQAAGQIDTMAKGFINLFEAYGLKEKVTEKIKIETDLWDQLRERLEYNKRNPGKPTDTDKRDIPES